MATDLIALTAQIIHIRSESRQEQELVAWLEADLAGCPWLELTRVGDNLVARTDLGRSQRLILAGHTDTVPANGNERARVVGDRLYGLGATDMKSGLAVMLQAARTIAEPAVDVTYVFYAREEIESSASGLAELLAERPDLLVGDAALLGEPTSAAIEAGCQGTMRIRVVLQGARSHTARPWMGRNAVHRLAGILTALADYDERRPVLDGCEYREALQAVRVEGGVAANVVPDRVELTLNHRFAPDRNGEAAEAHVRAVLEPWLEPGDEVTVVDLAPGAPPDLDHPLLAALRTRNDLAVDAKLGWTDVARFAAHGIPAANFGPGDATIAHTADEFVERDHLDQVWAAIADLLRHGS